ncbi:D-2-hydroxyacid dehydrogenase family protein [Rouxiella sp. Mn2063]|uniref:D-2-hydroxyacid dehydrogenase family protein n=1 Tax=Rouxiella sp. Mn2063 TaxID=3395262 RepID=UPI003BC5907B
MPLRCAILDDYQHVALSQADWTPLATQIDITTFSRPLGDEQAVADSLKDFDIIVIMRERTPFPASLLAQLPKLKLLITSGMRNASIDIKAAQAQGIVVCGTASGSSAPVELTWALILGLARHLVPENAALRQNGPWQSTLGFELQGKQLGVIGLGKTGEKVAKIAQAFGMKVVAWSQNLTAQRAADVGVTLAESKESLLASSDIVSLHLVLSDRSRNTITADDFTHMKSTALLINTSRAGLVDQAAMINALQQQQIAGAGVDVFDIEPLPADSLLRTLPTLLATPHLGYVTDGNYQVYFTEAVEDILAWLAGKPVRQLS